MAAISVLKTIAILMASFLAGMGLYFVMNPNKKTFKKQQLEELSSVVIQFIIYLWVGKAIVFFPKLLTDPIAVLAYPSNSTVFYVATVLIVVHLLYKIRKGSTDAAQFFETFIVVWIGTLFTYEFLQIVIHSHRIGIHFLGMMVLLIFLVLTYEKITPHKRDFIFLTIWLLLATGISFIEGYIVLFDFMIHPIFFIVLIFFTFVLKLFKNNIFTS